MGSALGCRKAAAARIGFALDEYDALVAAGQKWCRICKAWQPRSDFNADRTRSDGLVPRCRASFVRSSPGPSNIDRRAAALRGEAWCRRCEAWCAAGDVHAGLCRPHINEVGREHYRRTNGRHKRGVSAARRRGIGWVGPNTREMLFEATAGLCAYGCGRAATQLDHVIPVARGGITEPGNIVPACRSCNSSKRDREPLPWIERMTPEAIELILPGLLYDGPVTEYLDALDAVPA